jgi:prepilin-type N-terminal cleavage/methylation domain-containing protein
MPIQRLPARHRRAAGFTLVELLVSVTVILVLAGIAAIVAFSGVTDSHAVTGNSDRLSGWLLQSRAKAKRDGSPAGVRFIVDADGFIRTAQYIEVPEPYIPNRTNSARGLHLAFSYRLQNGQPLSSMTRELFIFRGDLASPAAVLNEINPGDVLSLPGFQSLHRITTLGAEAPIQVLINGTPTSVPAIPVAVVDVTKLPDLGASFQTITNAGDARQLSLTTSNFGILRQAQPLLGEPPLELSETTAVDNIRVASTHPTSVLPLMDSLRQIDVLFGSTGEVINAGGRGRLVFWMRNPGYSVDPRLNAEATGDSRSNYDAAGEMVMVVVYTKTGVVAAHPVNYPQGENVVGHDPYAYTRDGVTSGL